MKGLLRFLIVGWVGFAAAEERQLYSPDNRDDILKAAREIIRKDPNAALISVDSAGQPRARTMLTRPPEDDMVIWVSTRPSSRKVEQIRQNPKVTLYYSLDDAFAYVSVMGTATFHDGLATKESKKWRTHEHRQRLWPNYPDDYLLIRIVPDWIEVTGEGIWSDSDNWQPQAVVFDEQ